MKLGYIFFGLTVLLHPIGQILERAGMKQIGEITSFSQLFSIQMVIRLITNPYVVGGVVVSALGLVIWLGVLSTMKVSYIFPLGSVSYIVLAILARVILKEPISLTHWIGICVIVLGCYLINR